MVTLPMPSATAAACASLGPEGALGDPPHPQANPRRAAATIPRADTLTIRSPRPREARVLPSPSAPETGRWIGKCAH
jgi:hypothetical protein